MQSVFSRPAEILELFNCQTPGLRDYQQSFALSYFSEEFCQKCRHRYCGRLTGTVLRSQRPEPLTGAEAEKTERKDKIGKFLNFKTENN